MKLRWRLANKSLLTFLAAATQCFAADPFVGTWKPAELEKWKISPGGTGEERKSHLFTTELVRKDSYKNTATTLDGMPLDRPPATVVLDGQEHKDSSNNVTTKGERIDERHIRVTMSGNKGTLVEEWVISADGKTQTLIRKGHATNADRLVDDVFIYQKQPATAK